MKNIKQTKYSSFEDSLKRIEEIALVLEDGNLPLQKRVERFEEGIKLLRQCEKELKEVEFSIQKVIEKNDSINLEKLEE